MLGTEHESVFRDGQRSSVRRREVMKSKNIGFALGLSLAASGCLTLEPLPPSPQPAAPATRLEERMDRLEEQVAGLQMERARLQRELDETNKSFAEVASLVRTRLQDLENKLQAMDAARQADRQFIIESLSKEVAKVLNNRPASSPPPSAGNPPSRGGATADSACEYGVEHVVKPGETLSKIAALYKKRADAIMKANNIKNPNAIRAGQRLFIPE